jgi:hypothetical protein
MTTIIDGTSGITFPNSTVQDSAGQVLQVVNASTQTAVTNTTTTMADTGLTATITPKFSTSLILVLISQSTYKSPASTTNATNIKLFRGATDLGRIIYAQGYTNTLMELYSQATTQYLDNPATTSATTYKTQFANQVAGSLVAVQPDSNGRSTITLLEIAG